MIDDYPRRFDLLRDRQQRWVAAHGARVPDFCPHCGGACEFGPQPPRPAARIAAVDLAAARQGVKDATYRLLLRLHRARWIDEALLRSSCARVGASVNQADLVPHSPKSPAQERDPNRE